MEKVHTEKVYIQRTHLRLATLAAGAVLAFAGCGGSVPVPIYTLTTSSAPLRYELKIDGTTVVQLPNGMDQESHNVVEAIVAIQYGEEVGEGRAVTATFESVALSVSVLGNTTEVDVSALIGQPISGVVMADRHVEITDVPDLPDGVRQALSPAASIERFVPPLPTDGDAGLESWETHSSQSTSGPLELTTDMSGTARFAADTTWSEQVVRVIVGEGEIQISGVGSPPGSPGEIDFQMAGEYTTRHVWDAVRGVLLGSVVQANAEGLIVGTGFSIPGTLNNREEIRLLP